MFDAMFDATTTPRIAQKTVLATFPSVSKPGHVHEVRLGADGVMYCTCPSWRFQRVTPSLREPCTHMLKLMKHVTCGGVTLRAQGAVELPKPVRKAKAETPAEPFWTKL